jgi:hypothetical protein
VEIGTQLWKFRGYHCRFAIYHQNNQAHQRSLPQSEKKETAKVRFDRRDVDFDT